MFARKLHTALSVSPPSVNMSGLEWQSPNSRASVGTNIDHFIPSPDYIAWLATEGVDLIRLPFMWELIQPALYDAPSLDGVVSPFVAEVGGLHSKMIEWITHTLDGAEAVGVKVLLDLHNYASYQDFVYSSGVATGAFLDTYYKKSATSITKTFNSGGLTQSHLSDLWTRVVTTFDSHPAVAGYCILNEVYGKATAWADLSQAAVTAIRSVGSVKAIYIDGPYVNLASASFTTDLFPNITDPQNNTFREIHQYLDANRSGAYFDYDADLSRGFCVDVAGALGFVPISSGIRGRSVVAASKVYGKPVYVGEWGIPNTSNKWFSAASEFIRPVRAGGLRASLWATPNAINLPPQISINPSMDRAGKLLKNSAISTYYFDAGIENASLLSFLDPSSNKITVVARGSLISAVEVFVQTDLSLSANSVVLLPGVDSSGFVLFTPGETSEVSFACSRSSIAPPAGMTIYNTANQSTADEILQNTRALVYIAGSGKETLSGEASPTTEAIVPNSSHVGSPYADRTLISVPNNRTTKVSGVGGKKAWRQLAGYIRNDFLMTQFVRPTAASPASGNYNGVSPENAEIFKFNGSFYFGCAFSLDSNTGAFDGSNLVFVTEMRRASSISIRSYGTAIRVEVKDPSSLLIVGTGGTVTLNTIQTVICVVTSGVLKAYVNGVLDVAITKTLANSASMDNFSILGAHIGYYPASIGAGKSAVYSAIGGVGTLSDAQAATIHSKMLAL